MRLDEFFRRQVAAEDGADGGILDEGELDTEADDDGEDESHDEELECAQALEGTAWPVEDEDKHDIHNRDGTSCDEGDLGDEEVDGYCSANDLGLVSILCEECLGVIVRGRQLDANVSSMGRVSGGVIVKIGL